MRLQLALAFSLGVHLLAFLSFGLVENGTPQVRAYRRFVGAISLWLLLALLTALDVAPQVTAPAAGVVAHFLPLVLLLGGILPPQGLPSRRLVPFVLAIAIVLLPFTVSASPWYRATVELAYFVVTWSLAGIAVFRAMQARTPAAGRGRWLLAMTLLVVGVLSIGWLVGVGAIGVIAIISAVLASVVLYATVRLSLYAMRETASRTGALAADAAELDRHAVAGEIAAMVAHEVRNPLTGVRSLAQRLTDDTVSEDRRRGYADLIVREVDRIEQMIAALLGASAARRGSSPGETDAIQLCDDVALLVGERFRRAGVSLTVEAAPAALAAPRAPLAQALLNLLLNAVQQAPAVRHVHLSARTPNDDGARVELLVRDDGPGIPVEARETIWKPFHSGTGGSGLGLAVVHRLGEQWGWDVAVRDTPGGGATFVIGVPSMPAQDKGAARKVSIGRPPAVRDATR